MGILSGVLDFLFGKDPDIFDDKGQVSHQLPPEKWRAWEDRFHENPHYDFRQHVGRTNKDPSQDKSNH
jgi:hypothetical protein